MHSTLDGQALRGRVAVVAGATRGAGRGIAAALGEAGATVVCTGRSSVSGNKKSDYDRPETIEETAGLVDELGGAGVAIQVDHLEAGEVRALAHRIRGDYGGIDRCWTTGLLPRPTGALHLTEIAAMGARPHRRDSPSPNRRDSSAEASPRSLPTRAANGGISSR